MGSFVGRVYKLIFKKGILLIFFFKKNNRDQQTKEIVTFLIEHSSVPFFEILGEWIYQGRIKDTYREFFVEENSGLQKENIQKDYTNAYWEQRYTLNESQVPLFLTSVSSKVLTTGKYLNVLRESNRPIHSVRETFEYTSNEREYIDKIQKAYDFASKAVLNLLLTENNLIQRLRFHFIFILPFLKIIFFFSTDFLDL